MHSKPTGKTKTEWEVLGVVHAKSGEGKRQTPAISVSVTKTGPLYISYSIGFVKPETNEFVPRPHIQARDLDAVIQALKTVKSKIESVLHDLDGRNDEKRNSLTATMGEISKTR